MDDGEDGEDDALYLYIICITKVIQGYIKKDYVWKVFLFYLLESIHPWISVYFIAF